MHHRLKKVMGAATVLAASFVGLTATPAHAVDWCGGGLVYATPNYAYAYCESAAAGSSVRVVLNCYHVTPVGSIDRYTRYGSWVPQKSGYTSKASCVVGDRGNGWHEQVK